VLGSSGGGAQGASTSSGLARKQGKNVEFTCEMSVAKGTLSAGTLTITGLPYPVSAAAPGVAAIYIGQHGAITLAANYAAVGGFINGATIALRKTSITGFSATALTLAECDDPVELLLSGSYIAA
jgi:hypothetical protein